MLNEYRLIESSVNSLIRNFTYSCPRHSLDFFVITSEATTLAEIVITDGMKITPIQSQPIFHSM